jgi:hypothetical protein
MPVLEGPGGSPGLFFGGWALRQGSGTARPGRDCRLQETERGAFLLCSVHSARKIAERGARQLRFLGHTATSCYRQAATQRSGKRGGYELDHIGGGAVRVVFNRAGRGLSVRPLHTRSGTRWGRQRSRTPCAELPASREARKNVIARDNPDQSAARRRRQSSLALNSFRRESVRRGKGYSFPAIGRVVPDQANPCDRNWIPNSGPHCDAP